MISIIHIFFHYLNNNRPENYHLPRTKIHMYDCNANDMLRGILQIGRK